MRLLVDEHGLGWSEAWRDHPRLHRLHQPHAAAGGARELAGVADGAPAAAPRADHPPAQRRPARGAVGSGDRPGRGRADRRSAWPARAHGPSRLLRRAQGQRRLGAAHRADEAHRVQGAAPGLSRTHHQQDQRHHRAALAAPVQPGAGGADHRSDRRRLARPISSSSRPLAPLAEDARLSRALRARQARQQGAARGADRGAHRHRGRSGRDVRRPDQADPRVQAAAAQHPGEQSPPGRRSAPSPQRGLDAAGQDLRRQGGRLLPPGQADHQADQRRGADDQQRSGRSATGSR